MNSFKDIMSIVFGSDLLVEGKGRTFAKAPVWLAGLAGLSSLWLAALTALLVVAFGMKATIVKK
ncbi:MAG: hypothetical protein J6K32_07400 [Clostridia bacterium]|nr:hypothetical protein [Clostridia bacterium]